MAKKVYNYPLLEGFVRFFRLPWYVMTTIVAILLLLLLILVVFLEGGFNDSINWEFWRLGLQSAIIVYIFTIYPFFQRLWKRAIQAFQPLLPDPDQDDILVWVNQYNRRWEWTSLFLGAIFFLLLGQPWNWSIGWVEIYTLVTSFLMFSLLGYLIYGGLSGTRRISQLNRRKLRLDIFDTSALVPVARWSYSISLAFLGGISLSVAFQPIKNLLSAQNITIYAILVCVTVLLFFVSLWSTHNAMASAKKQELAIVRENLVLARNKLRGQAVQVNTDGTDGLYSAVAAWGIYERQVQEAREWPYNAIIIRRLTVSVLFPGLVYLLKIIFGVPLDL